MSTAEFDDTSSPARPEGDNQASGQSPSAKGGVVAPEKRGQLYTMHAFKGVNAAELINSALKKRVLGKSEPRRVDVAAPSGPSTANGRKARQSITLTPVSGQGQAIMLGYLDVAQKTVGLRDYELVCKQYKARFRAKLEISAEEYQVMVRDLTGMVQTLGFKLVREEGREGGNSDASSLAPPATGNNRTVLMMVGAAVVIVVLAALLLVR